MSLTSTTKGDSQEVAPLEDEDQVAITDERIVSQRSRVDKAIEGTNVSAASAVRKATTTRKTASPKAAGARDGATRRTRRTTLFPAATFEDAIELASAIFKLGSGQPVRRITLFNTMGKSPDSGASRQLITNSAKYGLTTGSYSAEQLALTAEGLTAVADEVSPATQLRARFKLAVESNEIFKSLYETYLGNRLPAQAVLADKARELGVPDDDVAECIETFTVNTKFVGVLRSISGAERFVSIDTVVDDFLPEPRSPQVQTTTSVKAQSRPASLVSSESRQANLDTVCFYITPIGEEGSDQRKHSDLFMGALIEPALAEFGLNLVRADKIGEAGMITGQVIEHIVASRLVIVDLSYHNPNVFYELALRHAVRKPIVQICRVAYKLPFDISQVRTIVVDTTDIYTFVPQLESLKAQIAAQIRKTLDEASEVENPLSVFAPYFWDSLKA